MIYLPLLILAIGLSANSEAGEIYKSQDQHGTITYSDKKPKREYEIIDKGDYKGESEPVDSEIDTTTPDKRSIASIRSITATAQEKINNIYHQHFLADRTLRGTLQIAFSINQSGRVIACREDESAMTKASFEGKVCAEIKHLEYGSVETDTIEKITYTYNFSPVEE